MELYLLVFDQIDFEGDFKGGVNRAYVCSINSSDFVWIISLFVRRHVDVESVNIGDATSLLVSP
jgi:hypothetical protein